MIRGLGRTLGRPRHPTLGSDLPSLAHAFEVFTYAFKESLGRHPIRVVAQDVAGNRRSASVKVRNT